MREKNNEANNLIQSMPFQLAEGYVEDYGDNLLSNMKWVAYTDMDFTNQRSQFISKLIRGNGWNMQLELSSSKTTTNIVRFIKVHS